MYCHKSCSWTIKQILREGHLFSLLFCTAKKLSRNTREERWRQTESDEKKRKEKVWKEKAKKRPRPNSVAECRASMGQRLGSNEAAWCDVYHQQIKALDKLHFQFSILSCFCLIACMLQFACWSCLFACLHLLNIKKSLLIHRQAWSNLIHIEHIQCHINTTIEMVPNQP